MNIDGGREDELIVIDDPEDNQDVEVGKRAEGEPPGGNNDDGGAADDPLAALQGRVAEANQRTEAERRRADELQARLEEVGMAARQEAGRRLHAQEAAVDNAITASKSDIAGLEKEYAAAVEAGNTQKQVEINSKLLDAKIALRGHEGAKHRITQFKEQAAERAKQMAAAQEAEAAGRTTTTPSPDDKLSGFTAPTRKWIENQRDSQGNIRFLTDRAFEYRAYAAHEVAVAEGLEPDTPEYFKRVEKEMGIGQDEERRDDPPPRKQRTNNASAGAPPSRGNGSGQTRTVERQQKLTLTRQEAELAENMSSLGDTREERLRNYALNRERARANGELGQRSN